MGEWVVLHFLENLYRYEERRNESRGCVSFLANDETEREEERERTGMVYFSCSGSHKTLRIVSFFSSCLMVSSTCYDHYYNLTSQHHTEV